MLQQFDKKRVRRAFLLAPLQVLLGVSLVLPLLTFLYFMIIGENVSQFAELLNMAGFLVIYSLIVGYLHLIIIALPLLLFIKSRRIISKNLCITLGFFVGFLPIGTAALVSLFFNSQSFEIESAGLLIVFFKLMIWPMGLGLIGAVIGLRFWQIGIRSAKSA